MNGCSLLSCFFKLVREVVAPDSARAELNYFALGLSLPSFQSECTAYLIFGASLSEPHTSRTALQRCVYAYVFVCGHIP